MTIIAEEFKKLVLEKTGERESEAIASGVNFIVLSKIFECIICYRTIHLQDGFWGIADKWVSKLKRYPHAFVFLLAPGRGYLMKDKFSDEFFKWCSHDRKGDYKIHEGDLRSNSNILQFRTFDEFIGYLSPYKKIIRITTP